MANRHRGEIAATLGGRERRLCLTLGALADLEDAFHSEDLSALAARFGSGRLSAKDLLQILGAGLKGGGEAVAPEEIAAFGRDESLADLAGIAGALLTATFGTGEPDMQDPS